MSYPGSENDPDNVTGWDALLLTVFFIVLIFTLLPKEVLR